LLITSSIWRGSLRSQIARLNIRHASSLLSSNLVSQQKRNASSLATNYGALHAEGMQEGSQGPGEFCEPMPLESHVIPCTLKGCQKRLSTKATIWHPFRVHFIGAAFQGYRYAQPLATFFYAFGI
jgi:hypothetical protein